MSAEAGAKRFLQCFYRFHGFPSAITSDRGSNWVGDFWRRLCERAGIQQRLSTAFHPQTDGATERANQEPAAQLALNNRESSLGYSPFFLNHGYHVSPIQTSKKSPREFSNKLKSPSNSIRKADQLLEKLKEGQDLAQPAMAWRQQVMGESTDHSRQQA
ncbi:hypothetical protein K3495_g7846 [Podosphaera aphanis]|nr:hypothetical protein K3495_g7846 [Podosphaera aphanis]